MNIKISNILDLLEKRGVDYVNKCLSFFSCNKNKEIEDFLKTRAIDFSIRGLSITYLVYGRTDNKNHLLGYFTLTYKVIQIPQSGSISKTLEKKIRPFAEYDDSRHSYTVPAPLIAQFGKNDNIPEELYKEFHGSDMMSLVIDQILNIKRLIGGRVVYLECEDNPFLLDFYNSVGYVKFNKRYTNSESNVEYYHQLLKII